ncbi:MAG: helix-turn-helix domain-containing protein [Actinomadura sp.]
MPYVPTIRGRRLARDLRQIREARKLKGDEAAALVGWDQGKISRVENAKMRVTVGEVMELCEAYEISGERRAELIQLAREARKQGWWLPYRGVLKQGFSDYLAFESEADSFRSYQVHLIHGLLQTEDFARAVLRTSRVLHGPEEVDRAVEARVARQKRLTSLEKPLQMWQIIEEGALRRTIGDAATMRAQLDHLLEVSRLPNVSIQVIPYRSATHVALDGPFELLGFDDYPDVLYVEHFGGCRFFEKPEETTDAKVVFDHLRSSALNTADSAALIQRVAKEMYGS